MVRCKAKVDALDLFFHPLGVINTEYYILTMKEVSTCIILELEILMIYIPSLRKELKKQRLLTYMLDILKMNSLVV